MARRWRVARVGASLVRQRAAAAHGLGFVVLRGVATWRTFGRDRVVGELCSPASDDRRVVVRDTLLEPVGLYRRRRTGRSSNTARLLISDRRDNAWFRNAWLSSGVGSLGPPNHRCSGPEPFDLFGCYLAGHDPSAESARASGRAGVGVSAGTGAHSNLVRDGPTGSVRGCEPNHGC